MTVIQPLLCQPGSAAARIAMRGALTAALLMVSEGRALAQEPTPQAAIQAALIQGHTDQAVALGEAAVAAAPQDAALRAALGRAYLRAGRFEAAASALHDEWALGGSSGQTILGLALAQIACGQNRAALATLDRGTTAIAPAELGLALALAGDQEHGIAVLTEGVRASGQDGAHGGAGAARLRQNLAYAYALDGRWADARLTAGFDLPADQLDGRLQQWAQSMQSGGERIRIARLLDVPVIADRGMPAALALHISSPAVPLALAPSVPLATADAAVALPPPAAMPAIAPAVEAEPAAPVALPAAGLGAAAVWRPAALHGAAPRHHAPVPSGQMHHAVHFDHAVQLGAFSSAAAAQRAKMILASHDPQLRGHDFLISQANVHGRMVWRVATAGFDRKTAADACGSLKRHGGACFAYAVNAAPPRALLALADIPGSDRAGTRRR